MTSTTTPSGQPSVLLICHEEDLIDSQGLAAWLGYSLHLAGIVLLREKPGSLLGRLRRERRRVGALRLADALLFRLWYRLRWAAGDAAWKADEVVHLRARYPADLSDVPVLRAADPNTPEVRDFIAGLQPDLALARIKVILKPEIFTLPRYGCFVLHPGICPEYRNAHGCFWALANRDLDNVGMTLLRVDPGIDTGPVYLQASYRFDERRESHIVIQYRVVLENLDAIADMLRAICAGRARVLDTRGRDSAVWGQPWLSAYWQWKRSAREALA